ARASGGGGNQRRLSPKADDRADRAALSAAGGNQRTFLLDYGDGLDCGRCRTFAFVGQHFCARRYFAAAKGSDVAEGAYLGAAGGNNRCRKLRGYFQSGL